MKIATNCCLMLLLISSLWSQLLPGNDPSVVIKHILETGIIEGHDEKVINGMGDPSADIIAKIIDSKPIDKDATDRVLRVLKHAFLGDASEPKLQPHSALLLLNKLDSATTDAALKAQISDTKKFVSRYVK